MNSKFQEMTFIEKENDTFLEAYTLEEFRSEFDADYKEKFVGYFPIGVNVTYAELAETEEEEKGTVTYHKETETHTIHHIKHFNSTLELKRGINAIITEANEGKEYVTIYRNRDIVYF